ncbi:hypothetical protein SAMN06273572_101792 [Monaibacterium marinum]|uniref:Pyridoxal phosphate homeostasis protein n=1 Tax=Pontivivens marinum TaxID=1690039 RepID=A0A2C9CN40_9RHOB|nr:YggS family pyridoxal phosphate-dependent enzyme [Monaibacterium marinum]SOH92941.1 hypothetical protein SAMN06273572_101792 [Monaibacterium marinum]
MSLSETRNRIDAACRKASRDPSSVSLIAVSKVQPNDRVQAVLEQGHTLYGENKVQEAQGKWPDFRTTFPDTQVHLIGPLQSNKVRPAMELFDAIHTVDRLKLAQRIADQAQSLGRCPELFVQVNTGEEPQKAGITPAETDSFLAELRQMDLKIAGLMCIPPVEETPSLHFALLGKLAARNGLTGLSMGMSSDFEEAIAFGATHIRVGSAIFGKRDYG